MCHHANQYAGNPGSSFINSSRYFLLILLTLYQDAQLSIQVTSQETIQVHITDRIEGYEKNETGFEPGAAGWVACSVLPSPLFAIVLLELL